MRLSSVNEVVTRQRDDEQHAEYADKGCVPIDQKTRADGQGLQAIGFSVYYPANRHHCDDERKNVHIWHPDAIKE